MINIDVTFPLMIISYSFSRRTGEYSSLRVFDLSIWVKLMLFAEMIMYDVVLALMAKFRTIKVFILMYSELNCLVRLLPSRPSIVFNLVTRSRIEQTNSTKTFTQKELYVFF